jgi:hypothetical protein
MVGTTLSATTAAQKNSGTVYGRGAINFLDGSGISITVADDAINDQVDVTVATSSVPASSVVLDKIGVPTYSTAQHGFRFCGTAGRIDESELVISDAGGGNITCTGGCVTLRTTASESGELKFVNVSALGSTAIPSNTLRYVGVEYNAGSPQIVVRSSDNWDYLTDFPLGQVSNVGGTLFIEQNGREFADQLGRLIRRFRGTRPYERDERTGGLILGETGTRNVTLSTGKLWDRSNDWTIPAFDSSGASRFDRFYRDGAGGWTREASQSQWPNTQYDNNSGTLVTMTASRYANLWFYLSVDGSLRMLYGQNEYTTVAAAIAGSVPASLPPWGGMSRLIGRMVFQKSASTATQIDTVWTSALTTTAGSADHGALSGLGDDDHTQYVKADGTRAFTDGLLIEDTNNSHSLKIDVGDNLTAQHTLTVTVGDADRTLTLGGNATLNGGTHSGTNTGDQTITLTGDVTGTGTGSFAASIDTTAITGRTNDASPDGAADYLLTYDATAAALKKALIKNVVDKGASVALITGQATQNAPNGTDDYVLVYDAAAAALKKVRLKVVGNTAEGLVALTTRGDLMVMGAAALQRLALGTASQKLQSDGTDAVWADEIESKSVSILSPSASEKVGLFVARANYTVTRIDCWVGSATSCTFKVIKGTDPSAAGTAVVTAGTTANTTSSVQTVTSFDSATIASGDAVWVTTTAIVGTPSQLHVTVHMKRTSVA